MRNLIASVLVVASLSDCASTLQAPQVYPATLSVDWGCVDAETREDLVRGVERIERDSRAAVIMADARTAACEAKRHAAELESEHNTAWSWVGKIGTVAVVVGAIIGGTVAAAKAFGATK